MINVGILEEDLIGIKKTTDVKIGEIVVARINDEVTVKTLENISSGRVTLKPENSDYSNIEVDTSVDEFCFEGVCVGLLRNYS